MYVEPPSHIVWWFSQSTFSSQPYEYAMEDLTRQGASMEWFLGGDHRAVPRGGGSAAAAGD